MKNAKPTRQRLLERVLYGKLAKDDREFPKYGTKVLIYRLLGASTIAMVALYLLVFHMQGETLPYEIVVVWSACFFVYIALTQVFKWTRPTDTAYSGEIFAAIVFAAFGWMVAFNMFQHFVWGRSYMRFPEGYVHIVVEVIIGLGISAGSAAFRARWKSRRQKS